MKSVSVSLYSYGPDGGCVYLLVVFTELSSDILSHFILHPFKCQIAMHQ